MVRGLFAVLFATLILPFVLHADETKAKPAPVVRLDQDPRGEPEITICSQNLNNYGTYEQSKARLFKLTQSEYSEKESAIVKRIITAQCDLVAVQELLSKDEEEGKTNLQRLATILRKKTGRLFDPYVGASNDSLSRVGFLLARERAEVLNILSYNRVELPKLVPKERPRFFLRGPLELQLNVFGRGDAPPRPVSVVTFHFKSKAGKGRDPAELEWETYRMQMAEALRRVVESRHARSFASGETALVLLGDRNSNIDSASAELLEGSLTLKFFQGDAVCRLSKRGVALCKNNVHIPKRLFSLLAMDPQTKVRQGTFKYQGVYSWLDDILMPAESLRYAWERFDSEGDLAVGLVNVPEEASDHSMVWTRLNW